MPSLTLPSALLRDMCRLPEASGRKSMLGAATLHRDGEALRLAVSLPGAVGVAEAWMPANEAGDVSALGSLPYALAVQAKDLGRAARAAGAGGTVSLALELPEAEGAAPRLSAGGASLPMIVGEAPHAAAVPADLQASCVIDAAALAAVSRFVDLERTSAVLSGVGLLRIDPSLPGSTMGRALLGATDGKVLLAAALEEGQDPPAPFTIPAAAFEALSILAPKWVFAHEERSAAAEGPALRLVAEGTHASGAHVRLTFRGIDGTYPAFRKALGVTGAKCTPSLSSLGAIAKAALPHTNQASRGLVITRQPATHVSTAVAWTLRNAGDAPAWSAPVVSAESAWQEWPAALGFNAEYLVRLASLPWDGCEAYAGRGLVACGRVAGSPAWGLVMPISLPGDVGIPAAALAAPVLDLDKAAMKGAKRGPRKPATLAAVRASVEEHASAEAALERARVEGTDRANECARLGCALRDMTGEADRLRTAAQALDRELTAARAEAETLRAALAKAEAEAREYRGRCEKAFDALARAHHEHGETQQALERVTAARDTLADEHTKLARDVQAARAEAEAAREGSRRNGARADALATGPCPVCQAREAEALAAAEARESDRIQAEADLEAALTSGPRERAGEADGGPVVQAPAAPVKRARKPRAAAAQECEALVNARAAADAADKAAERALAALTLADCAAAAESATFRVQVACGTLLDCGQVQAIKRAADASARAAEVCRKRAADAESIAV